MNDKIPESLRRIVEPRFNDGCPEVFSGDGASPEHEPSRNLFCDYAPAVPPSSGGCDCELGSRLSDCPEWIEASR